MDENYEWDSEFPGDMALLETLHLGWAGPRPRPEAEPELGVRGLRGAVWPHCSPSPHSVLRLVPIAPFPRLAVPVPMAPLHRQDLGASWGR